MIPEINEQGAGGIDKLAGDSQRRREESRGIYLC